MHSPTLSPPPPLPPLPLSYSYITNKDSMGVLLLHKEWRALSEPHPYDLSVIDITTHAPEYKEKGIALEDIFKPKKQCFLMANPHYGSQAEVLL